MKKSRYSEEQVAYDNRHVFVGEDASGNPIKWHVERVVNPIENPPRPTDVYTSSRSAHWRASRLRLRWRHTIRSSIHRIAVQTPAHIKLSNTKRGFEDTILRTLLTTITADYWIMRRKLRVKDGVPNLRHFEPPEPVVAAA